MCAVNLGEVGDTFTGGLAHVQRGRGGPKVLEQKRKPKRCAKWHSECESAEFPFVASVCVEILTDSRFSFISVLSVGDRLCVVPVSRSVVRVQDAVQESSRLLGDTHIRHGGRYVPHRHHRKSFLRCVSNLTLCLLCCFVHHSVQITGSNIRRN